MSSLDSNNRPDNEQQEVVKYSAAVILYRLQPSGENAYLLVREWRDGGFVYNQPVGDIEPGESAHQAALREAKEETGFTIHLEFLLGTYSQQFPSATYIRSCFVGRIVDSIPPVKVEDDDVFGHRWFTLAQLEKLITTGEVEMRNDMVLQCIRDYESRLPTQES